MSSVSGATTARGLCPYRLAVDDRSMSITLCQQLGGPASGLDPQAVLRDLADLKVALDPAIARRVVDALGDWSADPQVQHAPVVLVEGTPAQPGSDGRVVWEAFCDPHRSRQHTGEADEQFSHYASQIVTVQAGQVLGRVEPATKGQPGRDVFGRTVAAPDGKPPSLGRLEGCHVDEQGCIVADVAGTLEFSPAGLAVQQGLHIRGSVDFSTGHIDTPGSVTIDEDVADLFQVTSGSDISVGKSVLSATLRAAGHITIGGPLANHRKGVCLAGGDLTARLVDNSIAAVRGDIHIAREAVSSDLFAGGRVECPAGAISGGVVVARGGLESRALGSAGGIRTLIVVGVDWLLGPIQEDLVEQTAALAEEVEQRRPTVELLKANLRRLTHQQREQVTELEFEVADLAEKLTGAQGRLDALRRESDARCRAVVRVTGEVFPGTELRLGALRAVVGERLAGPVDFLVAREAGAKAILAKTVATGQARPLRTGRLASPLEGIDLPELPPEPATT